MIRVAIDGPAGVGKSSTSKALAKYYGFAYLDTGAMYRAVSLFCIRNGWMTDSELNTAAIEKHIAEIQLEFRTNENGKAEMYMNGENIEKEIRTLDVANGASKVSTLGAVRRELVRQQQKMGEKKGIVMDGRDIGTVVFPDAELKLFMTASSKTRAQRRFDELVEKGQHITFEDVLQNVEERDYIDTHREDSPLVKADDAIEVDNSSLTKKEQFELVLNLVKEKM